ncbi:mannose-6-phosphate isomerase, class I [Spirochaetia bacterium]|nr:mannose-6-phosphate isomerase, class I [Spirochaetia bacterium]
MTLADPVKNHYHVSMEYLFKLKNPVKYYAWGNSEWIPQLLGQEPDGHPWAEMWMGIHLEGESTTEEGIPLSAAMLPESYVGTPGTLPFLFKVLAAGKALSIQAHPNRDQARIGYQRENEAGIPLDAPNRNYKDQNHKPEILCALGPFEALCGFRPAEEIINRLETFSAGASDSVTSIIRPVHKQAEKGIREFFQALCAIPPESASILSDYTLEHAPVLAQKSPHQAEEWQLCARLAGQYPGDSAVLAPLYLNNISLEPGQAIYVPAGVLHAYMHGFGVELMATSDNVLRGGLTKKWIDYPELFTILKFSPFQPEILRPKNNCYLTPTKEFSLFVQENSGQAFPVVSGPCIVIVTQGEAVVNVGGRAYTLSQGQSAFIPDSGKKVTMSGVFTLYAAGIGV